jgi:hypothetical protein
MGFRAPPDCRSFSVQKRLQTCDSLFCVIDIGSHPSVSESDDKVPGEHLGIIMITCIYAFPLLDFGVRYFTVTWASGRP